MIWFCSLQFFSVQFELILHRKENRCTAESNHDIIGGLNMLKLDHTGYCLILPATTD